MTATRTGIVVPANPETCELCGRWVGITWDVHMVLEHPETRPTARDGMDETKAAKKKGKKKS